MHKKLEADLISLAHSILQMKNKDNVFLLKQKSKEIYEKLAVLAFVEEYVNATPNLKATKTELLEKVETAFKTKEKNYEEEETTNKILQEAKHKEEKVVFNLIDEPKEEPKKEAIISEKQPAKEPIEQPFAELEEIMFSKEIPLKKEVTDTDLVDEPKIIPAKTTEINIPSTEENIPLVSDVVKVEERKTMSLEEELQDIISVDVMADLFENATSKSLNDQFAKNIQIGLNDRIAFVKHLFNNKQEDYNRVISQLNTFKVEKEAKNFITKMVKPDYNWSENEELETRFMEIIERKFS